MNTDTDAESAFLFLDPEREESALVVDSEAGVISTALGMLGDFSAAFTQRLTLICNVRLAHCARQKIQRFSWRWELKFWQLLHESSPHFSPAYQCYPY